MHLLLKKYDGKNLVQETIEVFSEVFFCCILCVFCSRLELKNDAIFLKGNTANSVFFNAKSWIIVGGQGPNWEASTCVFFFMP